MRYGIQPFQVAGGPRWIGTERWSVEAKAENFPGRLSREQLQKPLQDLLADKFRLRTGRETREMLVYALVETQSSPKLKPATEASRTMSFSRGVLNDKSANMDPLARVLATLLDRPD